MVKLPWDTVPGIKFTSTEQLRASVRPVSLFYTYRNSCSISLASTLFSVIDDIPTYSNESLHRQLYNFCTHNIVSLGFVSWTLRTSMKNTISFFQFYKKNVGVNAAHNCHSGTAASILGVVHQQSGVIWSGPITLSANPYKYQLAWITTTFK